MSKETELSDEQIDGCWDGLMPSGNGKSRYDIARAIIAADRELRRGDAKRLTQAARDITTVLRVEGMDLEIGSRKLLKEARDAIDAAIAKEKAK